MVLIPNIGFSTAISSTTKLQLQHFGKLMCIQYESRWCYYQILVLAPQYPVLPNYTPSTSENSCIQCENRWYYYQILVLEPQYPVLPISTPSTSENSCVFSVKTDGASTKYWFQHRNIQHYRSTPPALRLTHVYSI